MAALKMLLQSKLFIRLLMSQVDDVAELLKSYLPDLGDQIVDILVSVLKEAVANNKPVEAVQADLMAAVPNEV